MFTASNQYISRKTILRKLNNFVTGLLWLDSDFVRFSFLEISMFYVQDIAAESSLELVECIGQFESNLSAQFLALYQVSCQFLSHEFFKIKREGPMHDWQVTMLKREDPIKYLQNTVLND